MPGEKSNVLIAVEWLWARRGKDIWWTPAVLGKHNINDPSSPKLTDVESISIFKILLEKGLILQAKRDGMDVFLLHEAKEQEWNAFISSLKSAAEPSPEGLGEGHLGNTEIRIGASEILGGIVFVGIGSMFTEAELHYFAYFWYWLSVVFGLDGFCRLCRLSRKLFWVLFGLNVVIIFGLYLYQFRKDRMNSEEKSRQQPLTEVARPKFKLAMQIGDDPTTAVDFTNTLRVISKMETNRTTQISFEPNDCLVVPVKYGQSNVILRLIIKNDSFVDASSVEVFLTMQKESDLSFGPESGWSDSAGPLWLQEQSLLDPSNILKSETKSVCFRDPLSILAQDTEITPQVRINITPAKGRWFTTVVFVKSKDMNGMFQSFDMAFIAFGTNAPRKPFFSPVLLTHEGDKQRIALPPEYEEVK